MQGALAKGFAAGLIGLAILALGWVVQVELRHEDFQASADAQFREQMRMARKHTPPEPAPARMIAADPRAFDELNKHDAKAATQTAKRGSASASASVPASGKRKTADSRRR